MENELRSRNYFISFQKLSLTLPHLKESSKYFITLKLAEWTEEIISKALAHLSELIFDAEAGKYISNYFSHSIVEIVALALQSSFAHQLKCLLLGRLVKQNPHLLQTCLIYFETAEAPWCSDSASSKKLKKKKTELIEDLDVVECCWTFLQISFAHFKTKWDWSNFINRYIFNKDHQIVWIVCMCISKLMCMNEKSRSILLRKHFSNEEILKYTIQYGKRDVRSAAFNVELPRLDINETDEEFFSDVSLSMSDFTVNICGVILPVYNKKAQIKDGCLVLVKSTIENLRKVAIGISTSKAVCLFGSVGCGKSVLIDHLAQLTGRTSGKELLKVQLGEETDAKLLLGTYKCTDVPGEFIWESGVLTKAVMGGYWLLIEDIESATSDVAAVLCCLLEQNMISVPGFRDNVQAAPGFQLFMTHRLHPGLQSYHRKQTSATELLERHWLQVNVEQLNRDELTKIIQIKFPVLKTIASRMVAVYLLFSRGLHEETDLMEQSLYRGGRLISTRDLMKWCTRAEIGFDVASQESALKVLQDAIDIFCSSYNDADVRLDLAGKVAACLGIIKTKAEYYCNLHKPYVVLSEDTCLTGRVSLPKLLTDEPASLKELSHNLKFALTRESCCLLERIAVCISLNEPALLVGETGTGKTSTIQLLAKQTGHNLIVINMNQQSDSSDLLGGYKPVDIKQLMLPLRDEFEKLFRSFFNVQENLKFLENISICISKRMWATLLKLMSHSQAAAVKRLLAGNSKREILTQWRNLGEKIYKLQTQINQGQSAMAFSFIEGSLVRALTQGHWVLLDEINLASAETLQCLSGLLEGSTGSVSLLERGDKEGVVRHPNFRLLAAMNPANDFGKKDLPLGIRNRFTEFYVSEYTEKNDLILVVSCYLPSLPAEKVNVVVDFYLIMKKYAKEILSDSMGHKPVYSLRTLCRALIVASANLCGNIQRSLYEALCLSFLTQLNTESHNIVRNMIAKTVLEGSTSKSILKQPLPEPTPKGKYVSFEGYWVPKGPQQPYIPKKYLLTASVRRNLCDIARCVSLSNHPVLIQGETSVGKTSLITYLAQASGHKSFRINNHQHTDLQEYVGSYVADPLSGNLIFKEGVLVEAMRQGHWIILDELNLAPSEVLEALNRVLDDNRELFIPETQTIVKAHANFRLFATQNPPGIYGGRKMLSRAFRNRFVELHFDEIPAVELEEILHHRCDMPMSYCKKMVAVMCDLQVRRKGSAAFAGKQGYITLRDLFRWGERYRLANTPDSGGYYDWDQHIADEGYLVLAGRVRKDEESNTIKEVLEKQIKRTIDLERLFTFNANTSSVTKRILEKAVVAPLPTEFRHIVWTYNYRRLAVLVGKALEFSEPALLIGDTGCGKTTICQLLTSLNNQTMYSVNCHQHSESSDFVGGLRPVRDKTESSKKLFEWIDGPLVKAMKNGQIFLADEISLADDSVLERLNSLLEPERMLLISEKGTGDELEIAAEINFRFISTMNPSGDFGKKELSPALRNRLTEIWCEGPKNQNDLIQIIEHNVKSGLFFGNQQDGSSGIGIAIYNFVQWLKNAELGKRIAVSIRDILAWVNFINYILIDEYSERISFDVATAYVHGACLTFLDAIGTATTSVDNLDIVKSFRKTAIDFLIDQIDKALGHHSTALDILKDPSLGKLEISIKVDKFGIHPFYINKVPDTEIVKDFMFVAPTTCLNTLRLLRALQISSRAVLLEGNPGVGKTSVVMALARATGNKVTRINLSEQTDVSDLFGADLPVEGAAGGTFAWRDGPFLKALKQGHWILLDELNLASQSVVEGLNSVLDHRGEIFIPELGKTFTLQQKTTKIFACQNPQRQGGARKGLPQSFLNRFTQVFMEPLTATDYQTILSGLYPHLSNDLIDKMIEFNMKLVEKSREGWGLQGGPFEWNLRDLTYWIQTIEHNNPGTFVSTIYADRMRNRQDKIDVLNLYENIFGTSYPLVKDISPLVITADNVMFGEVSLPKNFTENQVPLVNVVDQSGELLILRNQLPLLRSLALCVKMGWMAILVGDSYTGKTSTIQVLAQLVGQRLYSIPVSSAMDTTELLGAFEQTDYGRHLDTIAEKVEKLVNIAGQKFILDGNVDDVRTLLHAWYSYNVQHVRQDEKENEYTLTDAVNIFNRKIEMLNKVLCLIPSNNLKEDLRKKLNQLKLFVESHGLKAGGTFEWIDSILVKCLQEGNWLVIDNVNLCSSAVLDRLNGLLEAGGVLTLGERGMGPDGEITIKPHQNFRIFLTMDPKHGSISRAMRNRGIEIYVDHTSVSSVHPFDLEALLNKLGITLQSQRTCLIEIHEKVVSITQGSEKPNLNHLLHAAFLTTENCRSGFSLKIAMEIAFKDVYLKSRTLTKEQKSLLAITLSEAFKEYNKLFTNENISPFDCFRPETKTLSTVTLQECSQFATIKQQSSLLLSVIELIEIISISNTWSRNLPSYQLNDIIGYETYKLKLPTSVCLEYQIIACIPFMVISYYNLASHSDIKLRHIWLEANLQNLRKNNFTVKIVEQILKISEIVSSLLFDHIKKCDIPWDVRQINCEQLFTKNFDWSSENKIILLIFYKVILGCEANRDELSDKQIYWQSITAWEYSHLLKKGTITDIYTDQAILCEISTFLEEIDKIILELLTNKEISMTNEQCCHWLYNVAWKFRLSNTANRRLFIVRKSASHNIPQICEETLRLIVLHYKWFRKYIFPEIRNLITAIGNVSQTTSSFLQLVKKFDDSIEINKLNMIPTSRKIMRSLHLPPPHRTTKQCDISKIIHRMVHSIDAWKNLPVKKMINNFLFLSEQQLHLRSKLIDCSERFHLNCSQDEDFTTLEMVENNMKDNSTLSVPPLEKCISIIKLWPFLELICLQLNIAVRVHLSNKSDHGNIMDHILSQSLIRWLEATDIISPAIVGIAKAFLKSDKTSVENSMQLSFLLLEHINNPLTLMNPVELLKWNESNETMENDELFIEGCFPLNVPLIALYLSTILKMSRTKDMSILALKEHSSTTDYFKKLKLLLWRNLTAIFSNELDMCSNEELCLKNSIILLIRTLIKHLLPDVDNNYNKLPLDQLIQDYIPNLITALSLFSAVNEIQNLSQSSIEKFQPPELQFKPIVESLQELAELTIKLDSFSGKHKFIGIGKAWLLLGHIYLMFFTKLELVDPIQKKAIKRQYTLEEIRELRMLICVESLNKSILGDSKQWPLKLQHETRIQDLTSKAENLNKATAVRPCPSLYNNIHNDLNTFVNGIASNSVIRRYSMKITSANPADRESIIKDGNSWIRSLTGFKQNFYYSYYVTYPDIVTPVLLAISQIIHGMKLVCSSNSKIIISNECEGDLNVQDCMSQLSLYPIPNLQSVVNLINIYSSAHVIELLKKSQEITKSGNINEYKTKLAKICVRLTMILVYNNLFDNNVKGQLFNILDYIVKSWEIIQNEQQIKLAQEQSIYINKLTPLEIEEEETKRSISQIFPSRRDEDFGDLENMASLEYQPQKKSSTRQDLDKLTLSQFDIKDICKMHTQIVETNAKAHWIYKNETTNDDNNNNIILFNERINIFIELMEGLYLTCDKRVDFDAVPALMLALHNTFDYHDVTLGRKYDFYRDANICEAKQCNTLLNVILTKVDEMLCEWPEHPTLKQIEIIIKRIINFSITSSISRFLTGLEILLTRLHEWEENAHDGVSLASHTASLTELIIKWRKLELTAWKGALNSTLISAQENASKWWFYIYSLITSYLNGTNDAEELIVALENYMESSPLGEYSVRLKLLWTFHCHCLLLPTSSKQDQLCKIFWNLHSYYKIFKTSINKKIKNLGEPIEKKLKDFVKLARWNDINYWAVKAAIEKTHRTIHKYIKEYQKVLNEPSNCAMIKLDQIEDKNKLVFTINFMNYLTPYKLPELNLEQVLPEKTGELSESLLTQLGTFLKRSRRICKSCILKCPYPDLLNKLLLLIEDVKETEILINNREIDQTLPEEKKRSSAKALLQRKRKAIADIFRILTQLGLSYRTGLLTYEHKNLNFTTLPPINISNSLKQIDSRNGDQDWLLYWNQTEEYFYTSVALSAQLKCIIQKPHQDLGPQIIERVKGFSSHYTKLIQDMKESLCANSVNLFRVRCLLIQLKNVFQENIGIIRKALHQQKETLKNYLDEIIFCVGQFKDLLTICPEHDMKDDDLASVPIIFPQLENDGLINGFKYSNSWQEIKDKIDSILKLSNLQKENLNKFEKNETFYKSTNNDDSSTQNCCVDIIKNKNYFELINNGYNFLKQISIDLEKVEEMFQPKVNAKILYNPLTNSLNILKVKLDQELTNYSQLEFPQDIDTDNIHNQKQIDNKIVEEFENITEIILQKSLIIIQNIFKNYVQNTTSPESQEDNNVEIAKETETQSFLDNHIKDAIVEKLLSNTKQLNLDELVVDLQNVFYKLVGVDNVETSSVCQRLLISIFPHLDQLTSLSQFIVIQQTSAVKVLCKLHTSLLSLLVNFSQNGYNIPEGLLDNEEGEGDGTKGGLGLGDGEGDKDISDQIESQDQLEDAKKPGEYDNEQQQKECKEEEKGIEMEEDMGGKLQDLEKKGEGDEEEDDDDKEEADKEMGDTDKGDDILDKEIWGSDSEEEPDDDGDNKKPEETQGTTGAEETEKEMGAREDDDEHSSEEKENKDGHRKPKHDEINEEADDEEQVDPYHNKRPPTPEVEPLNLEDQELKLDELEDNDDNDEEEDEDKEENPFDIDDMKDKMQTQEDTDENAKSDSEEKKESAHEEEEPVDVSDNEDPTEQPHLKDNQEDVAEEPVEEQPDEVDEKRDGEELEQEESKVDEKSAPDTIPSTSFAQSSEQKLAQDQVTGNSNELENTDLTPQESMAMGEEKSGEGAADQENVNIGGQRGDVGKQRQTGSKQRQDKRQRPGHSDLDRSLGELNEPASKKLKAIDIPRQDEFAEDTSKEAIDEDPNADLYQHIHESKGTLHDTQIIDAATKEQAEKQPVVNKEDEESEELKEDDGIMEIDSDDLTEDNNVPKHLPENVPKDNNDEAKEGKPNKTGDKPGQETSAEVEGDFVETQGVHRGTASSYHTRQEELDVQHLVTEAEILSLRVHLEQELASWSQPPDSVEAIAAWEKLCSVTSNLAKDLSEQLRLVLEPTNASGLKGDFRTGRRINMRKVIPYIASQFRKDKIWLRRTKPSKREYQIILAVDDSSSMADNHSKELAFESLALVSRALNLLEAGDLGVLSFGETTKVLHQLGDPFNEYSGAKLLQQFSFDQKKTKVGALVDFASALLLRSMKHSNADVAQLLIIVSDGRGVLSEGEASVRASVRKAKLQNIFMVFVIIDNPESKNSILDIRMPRFKDGKLLEITSYMDNFPFPFYLILRDINFLPCVLSDALRQWFELVTNLQ